MKKLPILLAVLGFGSASMVLADANSDRFKRLDSNGDGTLDLEEYRASAIGHIGTERIPVVFKLKDKDADGKLTQEEYYFVPPKATPEPAKPKAEKKEKAEKTPSDHKPAEKSN